MPAWLEGIGALRELFVQANAAATCRPEQQGILIAITLILTLALLLLLPLACCGGCFLGASSAAFALSSRVRHAVRAAFRSATSELPLPAVRLSRSTIVPPLISYLQPHRD